jgi:hypothetical protein
MAPAIKTIFLSGYTAEILQHPVAETAREALIMKPVEPGKLLEKIRDMLDGRAPAATDSGVMGE